MLLRQIGIEAIVVPADVDEILDAGDIGRSLQALAEKKATTALAKINNGPQAPRLDGTGEVWVIGADTIVLLDSFIFGKAEDEADARRMLERLSGNSHRVQTGVSACKAVRTDAGGFTPVEWATELVDTEVVFKPLSRGEISWYLSTGEWREAAGAYRIQGKGACLVSAVHGSFSNVVGLPLERIYGMLVRLGFPMETCANFPLPERGSRDI